MRRPAFHLLLPFALLGLTPLPAAEVSLESLLDEMVDRERLSQFPSPPYTCRQFSSYDRDTVSPDKPGWFANWDRSQFVRTEENNGRTEKVLLDAEGPGAIVRFWGTWHGPGGGPFSNGTLRVYLDGADKPAIEGPAADIISGGILVSSPLCASVSPETDYAQRGHNLYLPIPYARHCKITYETDVLIDRGAKKGEALYYQINYRTYPEGTPVRSFSTEQLEELSSKLEETKSTLLRSGVTGDISGETVMLEWILAPGEERGVKLTGPAAVRRLSLEVDAEDAEQALRSTILEIHFDGERCVWCPVGDFFGTGYRTQAFQTWYTRVRPDGGMECWWVMPFERSCRLVVRNVGEQSVKVSEGKVECGPWKWDEDSLHFHATWHQYTKIKTGPNKDMTGKGAFDVNYVSVRGRGRYVGDTLTLFNGTDAWWGEGDEKIFVDGESFPSHVGTGTEDYYGYAWCKPARFSMPFHAQPDGSGNLRAGFSVNSRYRSLDSIPFDRSLQVDMELWHWRRTRMNYAPSAFWYARPGATSNVKPDPETAALEVARTVDDVIEILRVPGAIEGESLRVSAKTGGRTELQRSTDFDWSGAQQLWWLEGKEGDRLVLEFPAEKTGRFRVKANLTKAVDYGMVRLSVNGKASAKSIDRYHPSVEHDLIDLGVFDIREGKNRLEVEITGANPKAVKKYMFGLDYLLLEPVD